MAGMPERKVVGGKLPAGMVPSGEMSSYTPTARERVTDYLRGLLFTDDRAGQAKAERLMSVGDAFGLTAPTDAYEVTREAASGRPAQAGMMLGMAMLPGSMRGMSFLRQAEPKLKAYHISPYDFDKFRWDADVRGTGEGAQVYGDGLYFAQSPKVSGLGGHYWNQFLERIPFSPEKVAANWRRQPGVNFDREAAAQYGQALLDKSRLEGDGGFEVDFVDRTERWQKAIDLLRSDKRLPPYGYEVDLKMRPDNLIQWDKPMIQQPKPVLRLADALNYDISPSKVTREQFLDAVRANLSDARKQFASGYPLEQFQKHMDDPVKYFYNPDLTMNTYNNIYSAWHKAVDDVGLTGREPINMRGEWIPDPGPTGEVFYRYATRPKGANLLSKESNVAPFQEAARNADVHGTMFLDGNSRSGTKNPTSNFAIWTPELIDITKKFAIPGLLGYGMLQAATNPNRETQ